MNYPHMQIGNSCRRQPDFKKTIVMIIFYILNLFQGKTQNPGHLILYYMKWVFIPAYLLLENICF